MSKITGELNRVLLPWCQIIIKSILYIAAIDMDLHTSVPYVVCLAWSEACDEDTDMRSGKDLLFVLAKNFMSKWSRSLQGHVCLLSSYFIYISSFLYSTLFPFSRCLSLNVAFKCVVLRLTDETKLVLVEVVDQGSFILPVHI